MTTNQKFLKLAYLNSEKQIDDYYQQNKYDETKVLSDTDCFMMGANFVLQLFNKHMTSSERNELLKQKSGESDRHYQSRLRNDLIEAMCSNRGYASCLEDS